MKLSLTTKNLKIITYTVFPISFLMLLLGTLSRTPWASFFAGIGFAVVLTSVIKLNTQMSVEDKSNVLGYFFQYGIGLVVDSVLISTIKFLVSGVDIGSRFLSDGISMLILIATIALCYYVLRGDAATEWREKLGSVNGTDFQDINAGDFVLGDRVDKEALRDDKKHEIAKLGADVLPLKDRFTHVLILGPTGSGKTSQILLPMTHQDILAGDFKDPDDEYPVMQVGQLLLEPKGDYAEKFWAMGKAEDSTLKAHYLEYLVDTQLFFDNEVTRLKKDIIRLKGIVSGSPLNKKDQKEYDSLTKLKKSSSKLSEKERIQTDHKINELKIKSRGRKLVDDEQYQYKIDVSGEKNLTAILKIIPKFANYDYLKDWTTYSLFRLGAAITAIITEPHRAIEIYKTRIQPLFKDHSWNRDPVVYFNPLSTVSPYFNPLRGDEDTVVDLMQTAFVGSDPGTGDNAYFVNMKKKVTEATVKIAKRLYGNAATLNTVSSLMSDLDAGKRLISELDLKMDPDDPLRDDTDTMITFMQDYYKGLEFGRQKSSVADNTADLRASVQLLLQNKDLKRVLNPDPDEKNLIDFDKILADGDKLAMTTANGIVGANNGTILGKLLMLHIQAAAIRRPAYHRNPALFYIDEFQQYADSSFEALLNQGRSYKVGTVLATQTLKLIEEKAGEGLVENIKANARSLCIFPGINIDDSTYFENAFGKRQYMDKSKVVKSTKSLDNGGLMSSLQRSQKSESIDPQLKEEPYFSVSDFQYGISNLDKARSEVQQKTSDNKTFGFVFTRLIRKNSISLPEIVQVRFLDRSYDKKLETIVSQYHVRTMSGSGKDPYGKAKYNRDDLGEQQATLATQINKEKEKYGYDSEEDPDTSDLSYQDSATDSFSESATSNQKIEELIRAQHERATKKNQNDGSGSDSSGTGGKLKPGSIDFDDFN